MSEPLKRYAEKNGYPVKDWNNVVCKCGSNTLKLYSDDEEGGAFAICAKCKVEIDLLESVGYIESAIQNICNCDNEEFEIRTGQSVTESGYPNWSYIGAHCPSCNLEGVYVDWKER